MHLPNCYLWAVTGMVSFMADWGRWLQERAEAARKERANDTNAGYGTHRDRWL